MLTHSNPNTFISSNIFLVFSSPGEIWKMLKDFWRTNTRIQDDPRIQRSIFHKKTLKWLVKCELWWLDTEFPCGSVLVQVPLDALLQLLAAHFQRSMYKTYQKMSLWHFHDSFHDFQISLWNFSVFLAHGSLENRWQLGSPCNSSEKHHSRNPHNIPTASVKSTSRECGKKLRCFQEKKRLLYDSSKLFMSAARALFPLTKMQSRTRPERWHSGNWREWICVKHYRDKWHEVAPFFLLAFVCYKPVHRHWDLDHVSCSVWAELWILIWKR